MRHRRSAMAVLLAASLLAAGCGVRVDDTLREQAANAQLNGTGGGGGPLPGASAGPTSGPGATGPGATGPGATGPGATGPGATGPNTSATNGPNGGPTSGPNVSKHCSGGGNTDVGVTANSITVGNVADVTGPVPGLFQAASYGVDAYFRYINSLGGVCGRQLYVKAADSATDCTANRNAHVSQLPNVFGWVGSFSLYDDCGTDIIKQHPTVPDLSYALGVGTKANHVNNFPPQAAPRGYQTGMFCYWAKKYGDAVKSVGSLYPNINSAADSQESFKKASESCGWKWIYNAPHQAAQSTFQQNIIAMQRKNVKLVYLSAENAGNAAEIKNEADQQGFHPIWIIPIAYASDFVERVGSAGGAEGIVGSNLYSMFFNDDVAKAVPEVALFQEWMKKTYPGAALELYAMYGWAAAKMFVQIASNVGANLTRKAFTDEAKKVHKYDASGMLPSSDPAGHQPPKCYVLWRIHDGKYVPESTAAGKFRCDGTFVAR